MIELKDYDIMDIEAMDDDRLEKSESGKIQVIQMRKIRKIIRRLWRSWIVFNEHENREDERTAHYGPGGTIV